MTTQLSAIDPPHAGAPLRNDPDDRQRGGYLPTLDGWRAIAIALVLIAHTGAFYFAPIGPHPSTRLQAYATRCAGGVDVFFAISGLLICSRLLNELASRGSIDRRLFYIRRVFRILPPYLAYLFVIAVLTALGVFHVTMREWLASVFFVRNYLPAIGPPDLGWYTGHFWSLAVEEHFYLIAPLLLAWLGRRSLPVAGLLIAAVVAWRVIAFKLKLLSQFSEMPAHRTDLRIDALLWGCVAAFVLTGSSRMRQRLAAPTLTLRCLWLGCVLLAAVSFLRDNPLTESLRPALLAYVVLATVLGSRGIVGRILENKALRWVGRLSYSIYVWQQLFFVTELMPSPPMHGQLRLLQYALPLTIATAMVSYYLVEKPLLSAGRRWFPAQAT